MPAVYTFRPDSTDEGEQFFYKMFYSKEVTQDFVRRLFERRNTADYADVVGDAVTWANTNTDGFLLRFARDHQRNWLAPRRHSHGAPPSKALGNPRSTILSLKSDWCGPIAIGAARAYFSLRSFTDPTGATHRWFVVAWFEGAYLGLMWRNPNIDKLKHWEDAAVAEASLADALGMTFERLPLETLTLHTWWERYRSNRALYKWLDVAVRARLESVNLTARSPAEDKKNAKGKSTISFSGLEKLSRKLAQSALAAVGASGPHLNKAADALLSTFLREWGPLTYELRFELPPSPPHAPTGERFSAHFYFGHGGAGQELYQHVNCHLEACDALRALRFLVRELAR